jgi:hyperosmotically inducible protein
VLWRNAAALLAWLAWCAIPVFAAEGGVAPVVTGRRISVVVTDADVKERVETAMRSDPFFYDEHITITVKDGVVTMRGIVFDEWDLRVAKRIARRIPGVKRVINDLEIELGGE